MDIIAAATNIGTRLFPFFFSSKNITQISTSISETSDSELCLLWETVNPWFIEEYGVDKPLGDTFEMEDIKSVVKRGLKNADDQTQTAIAELLKQLETRQPGSRNTVKVKGDNNIVNQGISNSNIQIHTGTGDNIQGDKKVYNINKIDKADFS